MAPFINEEAIKKAYDMNKEDRTNIFAEMRKEFKDLLNSVDEENQKKAEAEKAEALKREKINSARVECLNSMIKYFKELGFCEKELSPEDIKELSKSMIEFEEEYFSMNNLFSKIKVDNSNSNNNKVNIRTREGNIFNQPSKIIKDIDDIFDEYFKSLR